MSDLATPHDATLTAPVVTAEARTVALLAMTAFLAVMAIYFIGLDEGAMSVFGKTTVLHELFHDGRHLLGFPCH